MKEQTQTTIFGILKLIPFAVVTAVIVLFWVDDFLGFVISLIFSWIPPLAIGLSIVFFIMGLRWRDIWQRIAVIWGGINVLLVVIYVLAVAPERRCNPDIMAEHYEKHHAEMEELDNVVKDHEPDLALRAGDTGLDFYGPLLKLAKEHLNEGGALMVEHGCGQGDAVKEVFEQGGLKNCMTIRDYGSNPRVTLGFL